jgi:hypothetical protein
VDECAVRVHPPMQARAALDGICWRIPGGDNVRRAVAGADRLLPVWRAAVMMGDIGEEITEIELEPLSPEMPAETPVEAPVEPAAEPVPG